MSEKKITTERVQVFNGDLAMESYLAKPEEIGEYPAIIVIQEIFGVNEHIRDITERIARQGYIAIAPAIYQRQKPGFEVGYTQKDLELGRKYKDRTSAIELITDIQSTIDYLYHLPNVKKTGVGTVGFCFGGHVVYLVSTLEDIKATASFYGAGIATYCPGREGATIEYTKDVKGVLHAFFGTEDPLIPNEQTDIIEQELKKHNIPHQVYRYQGATHGFMCDRRDSYNPEAAEDAWNKMLDLFNSQL